MSTYLVSNSIDNNLLRTRRSPLPYSLSDRLVVGVASSALFDLEEADTVFNDEGERAYRAYQEKNLDVAFAKGVAFSFIRRLLSFNELASVEGGPLVEVIVLSRNDPDTGLRVMRSIASHGLDITRAVFMEGKSPYAFIPAFNVALFLSGSDADVREAIALGHPAGRVMPSTLVDDDDTDLRIAFDFDGVLADDSSEQVMQASGLESFHAHETANAVSSHNPGPLKEFLVKVSQIQALEVAKKEENKDFRKRLHVALVTARNAPSHERAVQTLKAWGVMVNDAFFLGGIDKGSVLRVLRPHIFFDDQASHLASTSAVAPSVHIPFGLLNVIAPDAT